MLSEVHDCLNKNANYACQSLGYKIYAEIRKLEKFSLAEKIEKEGMDEESSK